MLSSPLAVLILCTGIEHLTVMDLTQNFNSHVLGWTQTVSTEMFMVFWQIFILIMNSLINGMSQIIIGGTVHSFLFASRQNNLPLWTEFLLSYLFHAHSASIISLACSLWLWHLYLSLHLQSTLKSPFIFLLGDSGFKHWIAWKHNPSVNSGHLTGRISRGQRIFKT
jgi:hypothetical protein